MDNKRDWIKAIFAGLVWFCAFAPLQCEPAAWLAPALVLWASAAKPKRAFCLGYIIGVAHFFSSLSWVLYIPVAGSNIVGWVALAGYCSIYPALWSAFCWWIFPGDVRQAGGSILSMGFKKRLGWGAACAVAWVAQECLRGWVITGFPWNYLGASQLDFTSLAMLAQYTGVLGVSLVVAWGSIGALLMFYCWREQDRFVPALLKDLVGPVALFVIVLVLGHVALLKPLAKERDTFSIALVQPSIEQTVLWNVTDVESQTERFKRMMDLSDRAVFQKPELLVWPEASLPPLGRLNATNVVKRFNKLEEAIEKHKVWRVWGSDTWTNNVPFNSALLIPPEDKFLVELPQMSWPTYAKRHLVMFGEYVPFSEQLPFLKKLAPVGNFGRGSGPVTFDLGMAKTSLLICFEDVVPKLARRAATPEVDFLLNMTNDGWFGDSHQQWQHARSAAWRAIETQRPLIRCCNNGITGWVDEYGQFHGVGELVHSEGVRMIEVPLREGPHSPTFYQRTGDWVSWGSVFVCGVLALLRIKYSAGDEKNDSELADDPAK